jgi:hypothetical protein
MGIPVDSRRADVSESNRLMNGCHPDRLANGWHLDPGADGWHPGLDLSRLMEGRNPPEPLGVPVENYFESRKSTQSSRFVHTHILTKIHSTCPIVSSF